MSAIDQNASPEAVTAELDAAYDQFIRGMLALSAAWEKHPTAADRLFVNYPDYLPEFNEFIDDMMGLRAEG